MLHLLWYGLLAVILAVGLFAVAARFLPAGEQIAPPLRDEPPWELPPDRVLQPDDVDSVRLPVALRGYRFAETDLLLDRLASELRARDAEIARLRGHAPDADEAEGGTADAGPGEDEAEESRPEGAEGAAPAPTPWPSPPSWADPDAPTEEPTRTGQPWVPLSPSAPWAGKDPWPAPAPSIEGDDLAPGAPGAPEVAGATGAHAAAEHAAEHQVEDQAEDQVEDQAEDQVEDQAEDQAEPTEPAAAEPAAASAQAPPRTRRHRRHRQAPGDAHPAQGDDAQPAEQTGDDGAA